MRRLTTTALLATALILTGCAAGGTVTVKPATTPTPTTPARITVDWTGQLPDAQRLIDEDTTAKNCTGLQDAFDVAATRNTVDLMSYIDEALELAGCY